MLGFIFGFNIRIGRLHYFLATIVLAVLMTAISFAIASYVFAQLPRGTKPTESNLLTWPVIAAALFFMWVTFNLQAMRIRDIGWDPVCVIPAWITVVIIDSLVAHRVPTWAIGRDHHGTIVGGITNLVFLAVLMFWPSGDYDSWTPSLREPRGMPAGPPQRSSTANSLTARIGQATRTDFGRRA
jgi:uncharacterized membrane protein YhaH (DUF805 family)